MKYSPTKALELLSGITRKRLYEMMNKGDISYEISENKRLLDSSELARVFGKKFLEHGNKKTFYTSEEKQNETLEIQIENRLLKQQIEALTKQIHDKEFENKRLWENIDKTTDERIKLTDTINKQTLLIEDMRHKSNKPKEAEPRKKFLGIF
jgi:predicted phosphohydrolase